MMLEFQDLFSSTSSLRLEALMAASALGILQRAVLQKPEFPRSPWDHGLTYESLSQ